MGSGSQVVGTEELVDLHGLFQYQGCEKRRKAKKLVIDINSRKTYDEADQWKVVLLRFGSLTDFSHPVRTIQ